MKRILFAVLVILALVGAGLAIFSQIGPNDNAAQIAQAEAVDELAGAIQAQALTSLASQCITGVMLVFFFLAGAGVALAGLVLWARVNAMPALPDARLQALSQNRTGALSARTQAEPEIITSDELFEKIMQDWR